mmetsp:Transcript_13824/g.24962  ORF Transcript_13824/g.24962 Transcript_13824/m.24962 type:complete len:135 (+) Transcript_13824:40-444(+)
MLRRIPNLRLSLAQASRCMSTNVASKPDGQFKAMIMLKRKDGISREEFGDWWLGQHKKLAMQLPGLKKYAVNLTSVGEGEDEPMYDGVAELWFERQEDLMEAYQTDIGASVAADSMAMVCKRDRLLTLEHVFEE